MLIDRIIHEVGFYGGAVSTFIVTGWKLLVILELDKPIIKKIKLKLKIKQHE